jgi:hypothetical protein
MSNQKTSELQYGVGGVGVYIRVVQSNIPEAICERACLWRPDLHATVQNINTHRSHEYLIFVVTRHLAI